MELLGREDKFFNKDFVFVFSIRTGSSLSSTPRRNACICLQECASASQTQASGLQGLVMYISDNAYSDNVYIVASAGQRAATKLLQ